MSSSFLSPHHHTYTDTPIQRARSLRKNLTPAEKKLWWFLRQKQLASFRFRRQVPMGTYILDFVCHAVKLVVEADGGQHNEPEHITYDQKRTAWLEKQGYHVLRFWNNEILSCRKENSWAVFESILATCLSRSKEK
jgi:very-short-patch-repair endonuclease